MTSIDIKPSRRQQILSALASMLQSSPGERITTAALAKAVGVSEAALYRHFPSKTKMYEGLIEFIEDSIFSRVNLVLAADETAIVRCEKIVFTLLDFAEQNPGVARLLMGDALTGETDRLRQRIAQFFVQLEKIVADVLSESASMNHKNSALPLELTQLIMAYVDGIIAQFVRSEFQRLPSLHWAAQWSLIVIILQSPSVGRG